MAGIGDKKPIRLEHWYTTKAANGDFKETVTKYNLWADVKRKGGDRGEINGQTGLDNIIEFRVYWKPNIFPTGNWRVIYSGRTHTIHSIVKENEDRFNWIITAESTGKR